MTLLRCSSLLVVFFLALSSGARHHGQLENFYFDKDMEKGMFSYGFEVEPSGKLKQDTTGMSFGMHHHRHDDGTQSWGYAIGRPLSDEPQSLTRPQLTPTVGPTVQPIAPVGFTSPSSAPSGPSLSGVTPGLFQAAGSSRRPVYVRRVSPPASPTPPDELNPDGTSQQLEGSEKVHSVVPFEGEYGARLPRRLQPDSLAESRWRGSARRVGARRQQFRRRPTPALAPSEEPESTLAPSEQQQPAVRAEEQQEPPVTTYRPIVRPSLATPVVPGYQRDLSTAPGRALAGEETGFSQSAPSAPIQETQVAAAAQLVSEYRGSDGSGPLNGADPRLQRGRFGGRGPDGVRPLLGVYPSRVTGGATFGFGQQGAPFRGNFPVAASPALNDFQGANYYGNSGLGAQNGGAFFGNDFPSAATPGFGRRNSAQLVGPSNTIRTSPGVYEPTGNVWQATYPENEYDQFGRPKPISEDSLPSTASPVRQQDRSNSRGDLDNPQDFTAALSAASDGASSVNDASTERPLSENDRSLTQPDSDGRYLDRSDGLTDSSPVSRRPSIRSGGRRPALRRARPAPDASPLLKASQTSDTNDDSHVFADPSAPSAGRGTQGGAAFRRRPSKAILLTAASVYQGDTTTYPTPVRDAVGQFVDPLNGTRIVIRRRLKKIPRVSTDKTIEPSREGEEEEAWPTTTTEASLSPAPLSDITDASTPASEDHTTSQPDFKPDRHRSPRPRVLAVGRRRNNRLQPRRKSTLTTETPATDATLKEVHPVEAPPTRRYRQRSRVENQRSQQGDGGDFRDENSATTSEEGKSDAVLARPPTDRLSRQEQRKASRKGPRRGTLSSRRRQSAREDTNSITPTGATTAEPEISGPSSVRPGGRRGNRPAPRRRPLRRPGIVRPGRRTTPTPEDQLATTVATEFTATTPAAVTEDSVTPVSAPSSRPTEEPARRQAGRFRLRRPGRPSDSGRRRWRTQSVDEPAEEVTAPGPESSQPPTVAPWPVSSYLPSTAPGPGSSYPPTTAESSYLPSTAPGPGSSYPPTTAGSSYPPTAAPGPGSSYLPSTAPGPGLSQPPSTAPGLFTTSAPRDRPLSLFERYNDERSSSESREQRLRALFDRNEAAKLGQLSDSHEENFRSLFTRKLEEKLSSSTESQKTTPHPQKHNSDQVFPDDAASREARIQALFAQYTKATKAPPSTTTPFTTTDPPLPTSTTVDPDRREAQLRALFAQYTKAPTTTDPSLASTPSADDLQRLFALHIQSLTTTGPTPVVVETFESSVSRVGATPSGARRDEDEEALQRQTAGRRGYLPAPTTPEPPGLSTVADVPPPASSTPPGLHQSQTPSPSDSRDRSSQRKQAAMDGKKQMTSTTPTLQPTTPVSSTEPSVSSQDPSRWRLDAILDRGQMSTPAPSSAAVLPIGNEVRYSRDDGRPRSTTRRPTRRPQPARPFDGFNGIDDERHAEKLTLDGDEERETTTELVLPVHSDAGSVVVSLLAVLLSSWLSLTVFNLTL